MQYYLTFPTFAEYEFLMVSVDSINNNIRVLPKSGGSDTGVYQFFLTAIFPNGQINYFPFVLGLSTGPDPCDSESLSATYSGPASYSYTNWGTSESGQVDTGDFVAGGGCTKRYETTISPAALAIIWPRGDSLGAEWNHNDVNY